MNSTTTPALVVTGTAIEAELTTFLRAQHVNRHRIALALQWIEAHGTATGCPNLEDDEASEANVIICNRLGDVESDPATWPACFAEDVWNLTGDDEDFSGMVPEFRTLDEWAATTTEPAAAPCLPSEAVECDYEPSHAERLYWASEGKCDLFSEDADRRLDEAWAEALIGSGVMHFPAICGGSPDAKPVKVYTARNRPVIGWSDEDQQRAHGCV